MDKSGGGIGDAGKVKIKKCAEEDGDRNADNSDKVRGRQKEGHFSTSDELANMTTKFRPSCHVILTRCDGLMSSGSSSGTVKVCGNHGQNGSSTGEKSMVTSDEIKSGLTNNEIRATDSRRSSCKPTLDPTNPTQVWTKKHICELCSKSFRTLKEMKQHIQAHTGERPHRCQICSKSFGYLGVLNNHLRTHTGEMAYQCKLCSKSFGRLGHLKRHIRTHTSELPYKCQICSKSFGRKDQLKRHIRSHTGERPYKCELCLKSFGLKGDLDKHIRTHTGELPYQCQICLKSFGQLSNLNRHVRTQHIQSVCE